jgi:murein DD-endopeptidase MepM/ murein hydrolase activator NlpD
MAGRKVFSSNTVLFAADVQDFLMDQSIMTFAGTAARSSAIASPTDGMFSYLSDTKQLQGYNGVGWATINNGTATIISAAYTAVAANAGGIIRSTSSSAITITVPDRFQPNDRIDIIRDGAGTVSIAAGTGIVTWAGAGTASLGVTFKIDQQFAAATVLKVDDLSYRVVGRVSV